jgi:peptidoglycan/xylan/chitin deacetylase (PgdA/CDA1 family)
VALTFDDGWNARTLRQIYRVLVREHVPATFFVTGIYVQRAPALWRQIAAAGFPLANHSYLHRDSRHLTAHQMAADLALTRAVVERTTGVPMLAAFRPPYGYRNAATDRRAADAGFPEVVLWDVTGGDTGHHPTIASVVRQATVGRPGSIVLLHAGPRVTPRALPRIIARYRARGFRFVTLAELLGITATPALVGAPVRPDPASRELDRRDSDRSASSRTPAVRSGAGGSTTRPLVVPSPQPAAAEHPLAADPVVAARVAAQAAPPARDDAWARGDGAPVTVALLTAGLLALLLAAAAAAGRTGGAGDDSPG